MSSIKVVSPQLELSFKGFGRAWPDKKVSNQDLLANFPAQSNRSPGVLKAMEQKIETNYGVVSRYMTHLPGTPFSDQEQTSESLALEACRKALNGGSPELFVLGSTTSARYSGSQAAGVLGALGKVAPAYEIKAGCSTSLAGLHMAYGFLQTGYSNVLVAAAETLSKVAHPEIFESWFGLADGAAAVWLENGSDFRVEKSAFSTHGKFVDLYTTQAQLPPRTELVEEMGYFLSGDSSQMREHAKEHYLALIDSLLPTAEERSSIRWILPHQVSRPLIEEVMREKSVSGDLVWHGRDFGNVGGASVLFAINDALEKKIFREGDKVLLISVGGGLSYAGQVWTILSK